MSIMLDAISKQGLKVLPTVQISVVYMASFKCPGLSFDIKNIRSIFDSRRRSNEDESSAQIIPGVVCIVIVQKREGCNGKQT